MTVREVLIERHSFVSDICFRFKVTVLIVLRFVKDLFFYRTEKFSVGRQLRDEEIISVSETELWNPDDTEQNWILTAGKIQNLRIAARQLHGTEVPANEVFSFWKQIGAPIASRGYVIGREIREGCIVPAVAGGLCQLSNALYDNALKSGFDIVERHKHTKVVKGSLAEIDRDATVKWNYIDLRFRSDQAFRIEVELTAGKLVVNFRSPVKKINGSGRIATKVITPSKLNDCYSCGNLECFKHPGENTRKPRASITTFILDGKWSEYDEYIKTVAMPKDHFILPDRQSRLRRSLAIRLSSKLGKNIFATTLEMDRMVATRMTRYIPVESTHLVIAQNLLPFIFENGALGGRTFDVLMTRLPIEKLHERLDDAHERYPQSSTLNDFRAPEHLIDNENMALTKARHIITPHTEIASIFKNKSITLEWKYPSPSGQLRKGAKVLFPGSALARKGAYEMRQLAKELGLTIKILGNATEHQSFWEGVNVEKAEGDPFDDVGMIVYPVYVEHQPRVLLKGIAAGIPVVTTTASGLRANGNVTVVEIGDYTTLRKAVLHTLSKS